jgi:hypothetical protein
VPLFIDRIRQLEEQFFTDQLDESDSSRMKSHGKYSWLYRPSHHVETGLITEEDVRLLSESGRHLLSVGAHPAYLEKILIELGVPTENMLVTDNDPELKQSAGQIPCSVFDMNTAWPYIGTFDLIIFPESLCIAIRDALPEVPEGSYANDPLEAHMLAHVLTEALARLTPRGTIKANGPMSHPKVAQAMSKMLHAVNIAHHVHYQRFFLTVQHGDEENSGI